MRSNNKNTLLKVVILGDGNVGKSCLMNRFVSNQFDEHSFHTIGVEFLNKDIEIDGETYTLQIWDTAGQERFKTLRTPFYRGSDICLLTYAIDDKCSYRNLQMWKNEFLYYADIKENVQFPFIVVGNKSDVSAEEREVSQLELETWCNENSITSFIETSAKTANNVQEAFKMAVQHWLKLESRADKIDAVVNDTVDLRKKQSDNRISCCIGSGDE
ncbi:ras-related protein Rab-9A [Diorhabda carinulata]|uniref:ras-related protein Rab-9A n=1 Tax=Diorhabda sublineata TaxID=1163346 RepID=UPI0024E14437|nr:ras-related protein Rab-9A [Diorhabda sublineata]XP_056643710.1 ras-related protein Rab-9A [Diorhabda sublineata]XP_057665407.1 ras-related protein Rab-9A [Diorhabda carinulata]XP_057665408.1 ras-related protein Rab-9A [Diorhabda carinulata]